LLSLQLPGGAFPGGLQGSPAQPSVFNTGQILQGLVRAHRETKRPETLQAALAAADWLIEMQSPDGSWSGPGAYQGVAHTYDSMVAWALAEFSARTDLSADQRCARAAERHLDWVLLHFRPSGWIDGIDLQGHPYYLHFIAYVLQGADGTTPSRRSRAQPGRCCGGLRPTNTCRAPTGGISKTRGASLVLRETRRCRACG